MPEPNTVPRSISNFVQSQTFFFTALAFFVFGASFIALNSLYPMAFDEEFHFGLIKIYASHLLPYGIEHTSSMAQYGAATADASYLFHYLMSFPYRFLDFIGLPDDAILIVLRFLNLAMVVAGLMVLRKAFVKHGVSPKIVNIALLCVTLLPTFVMLAAQVNYDNLLFLLFSGCIYLIFDITRAFRNNHSIVVIKLWALALLVLIGMSVKYAFLPLALAMFLWLLGLLAESALRRKLHMKHVLKTMLSSWTSIRRKTKITFGVLSLLGLFFAFHYVTNYISYGSSIPACDHVFSGQECTAYGPWNRNEEFKATIPNGFEALPFPAYMTTEWFPGMTERLVFAVAGKTNGFETKKSLPVVNITFIILAIVGTIGLFVQLIRRRVNWIGWFTVLLSFVYVAVLSVQLYGDYVSTAQPVAINGRYLLPLLPLVGVVLIQAVRRTLSRVSVTTLSLSSVVIVGILLFAGAGANTYIAQSERHWYWPGFGQSAYDIVAPAVRGIILPLRS